MRGTGTPQGEFLTKPLLWRTKRFASPIEDDHPVQLEVAPSSIRSSLYPESGGPCLSNQLWHVDGVKGGCLRKRGVPRIHNMFHRSGSAALAVWRVPRDRGRLSCGWSPGRLMDDERLWDGSRPRPPRRGQNRGEQPGSQPGYFLGPARAGPGGPQKIGAKKINPQKDPKIIFAGKPSLPTQRSPGGPAGPTPTLPGGGELGSPTVKRSLLPSPRPTTLRDR